MGAARAVVQTKSDHWKFRKQQSHDPCPYVSTCSDVMRWCFDRRAATTDRWRWCTVTTMTYASAIHGNLFVSVAWTPQAVTDPHRTESNAALWKDIAGDKENRQGQPRRDRLHAAWIQNRKHKHMIKDIWCTTPNMFYLTNTIHKPFASLKEINTYRFSELSRTLIRVV